MNKKNLLAFAVVIVFLGIMSFFLADNSSDKGTENSVDQKHKTERIEYAEIGGIKVKVDLAVTVAQQVQGLSGRSGLSPDEGMLFVFEKSGKYYFWMKDMNFAIDIIWIGEDMRVIYIKKDAQPPKSDSKPSLQTYGPGADSKYVLEVAAGFADKNDIKEGDRVEFIY